MKNAVDRLDGQINLIKRKIRYLSRAGDDITEDRQNEENLKKLNNELNLLESRRDKLIEEYYHMMIPR